MAAGYHIIGLHPLHTRLVGGCFLLARGQAMSTERRRQWVRRLMRGGCTQAEIVRAMGLPKYVVSRDVAYLRKRGQL